MKFLVTWSKLRDPSTMAVTHLGDAEVEAGSHRGACEQVVGKMLEAKAEYVQAQTVTLKTIQRELMRLRGPNVWFRLEDEHLVHVPPQS